MRWAREHARPTRPTGGRGRGPRGGRWRAALRGCGEMGKGVRVCVCVCERVRKGFCGPSKERVFGKERVRFLTRKGTQKCSLLCQWALTQKRTLSGGGALERGDLRLLEDGSERGGALGSDAVAARLQAGWWAGEREACQRALTQKRTLWGGGALERGHGAALERLAQLGDALGRVGAVADMSRPQRWLGKVQGKEECQWALTQKQTLGSWFEGRAAYLSDCSVELPLRPSARAAPPSGPSRCSSRLRGWGLEVSGEPCQWALTQKRTLWGGGALQVVICVSLRTAASAEAPSSPMSLPQILQARGRMGTVRE